MSQPPLGPPPATPPNDAAPSSRGRGLLIGVALGALLVGLVIGVLVGPLVFDDDPGSRAEADLDAGCAVVERLDADGGVEPKETSLDDPVLWELGGASQMFVAASTTGKKYEKWKEPGNELLATFQRFDVEGMKKTLETLVDMCADR